VSAAELAAGKFDEVVLATGIVPRVPDIEGVDHPKVLSYLDVLRDKKPVGRSRRHPRRGRHRLRRRRIPQPRGRAPA
jgi:NADPH-dependent 2,4-dienoyl-CoA reductase/sulfur reductase-like enzyme